MTEPLPENLEPDLLVLRAAFPDGISDGDYMALLVALDPYFSNSNLAYLVAALVKGDRIVVDHDHAVAMSDLRPLSADVERVLARVRAAGWVEQE